MPDRELAYRSLDMLKENSANPKDHDKATLESSVGRFGFMEPIVIDERTELIVSGHGRIAALREMESRGETPPDGIRIDQFGGWQAPVITGWSSRSDTEASAALIALNRTTETGGWEEEQLLALLNELSAEDALDGIGFDEDDIEILRYKLEEVLEETETPDDFTDEELEEFGQTGLSRLIIPDLTLEEVNTFRALPGETDTDRFRFILGKNVE